MSLRLPKCDFCEYHFHNKKENKEWCKAFPDGIPPNAMSFDVEEECANGIKFKGDPPYTSTPKPGSLLAKMHRI